MGGFKMTVNDRNIEKLWREFSNCPLTEDGECIDHDFSQWEKGDNKLEIWHWFDKHHSKGVVWLQNNI
jgi:hypothetical protein